MFISLLLCFKKFIHGIDESIRRENSNTKLMVSVIKISAHKTKTLQLNVLRLCNLMRKWIEIHRNTCKRNIDLKGKAVEK
jgi:hypothetical protein